MKNLRRNKVIIKNKGLTPKKNPLLTKTMFVNPSKLGDEGDLLEVYNESNHFVGIGYYGNQNKGCGWIISRNKAVVLDTSFFGKLFEEAIKRRSNYFDDSSTTAFRIFNGEGDGYGGITVDYFDGFLLVTWYNKGIYAMKDIIITSLKQQIVCRGIYEKKRFDKQGKYVEAEDHIFGEKAPEPLVVSENNIKYAIYLDDGPMVGVFLDQKDVRKTIRDYYAKEKTVLNTFSYTGAFSVAAALGDAKKTTSVDLANRSRSRTEEHFDINGIDPSTQDIIVEDVFNYFKYAGRKKLSYDLVILDPPSFARSKKRTFSVAKDYVGLLEDAIKITSDNGVIVASTNYSNFDMKKFKSFIDKAFKQSGHKYQILETFGLPDDFHVSEDFPQGDYLKVVFVRKLGK